MKNRHIAVNRFLEIEMQEQHGRLFSFYRVTQRPGINSMLQLFYQPASKHTEPDNYYQQFRDLVAHLESVNTEPLGITPAVLSWGLTQTEDLPFIQTQYINGSSLRAYLAEQGCLRIADVVELAEQVARTLAYCHNRALIHGAIDTNAIVLDQSNQQFWITGFGSSLFPDVNIANQREQWGRELMPTEFQLGVLLPQTDIFQIGLVLYEALCGALPAGTAEQGARQAFADRLRVNREQGVIMHLSADQRTQEIQIPGWLCDMIYQCLKPEPEHRFTNGVALHTYLLVHRLSANKTSAAPIATSVQEEVATSSTKAASVPLRHTPPTEPVAQPAFAPRRKALLPALALGAIFSAIGFVAFYKSDHGAQTAPAQQVSRVMPAPVPEASAVPQKASTAESRSVVVEATPHRTVATHVRASGIKGTAPASSVLRQIKHPWKPEGTTLDLHSGLGSYRVLSKAHFFNRPDESTERNAFIVHWNNAVLKPIKEENDFLYIVFTNIWGQTSKGWLRKKDLVRVDE